jgi:hypothetical protein
MVGWTIKVRMRWGRVSSDQQSLTLWGQPAGGGGF